jgi:RNA-binding protein YlmH
MKMTYNFDLQFSEPSKDDLSGENVAQIYVKAYSTCEKNRVFITPQCFSMSEFEYEIERLKKELDNLRKKAQKNFRGAMKLCIKK